MDVLLSLVPVLRVWPFSMFMPLIGYASVVTVIPALRNSVGWLHKGRFNTAVYRLVALAIITASTALVAWTLLAKPEMGRYLALIPTMPLWVYPFAAVAFAFFNAAMEEIIFRGIMMEALESAIGEGFGSIGVQAISFAALHFFVGFPNGLFGVAMVLSYGFVLGMVRWRSRGLLAPWVTHIAADLTIFIILAVILQQHQNPMT